MHIANSTSVIATLILRSDACFQIRNQVRGVKLRKHTYDKQILIGKPVFITTSLGSALDPFCVGPQWTKQVYGLLSF